MIAKFFIILTGLVFCLVSMALYFSGLFGESGWPLILILLFWIIFGNVVTFWPLDKRG
jgi:uncharacterized integral membrane protein